MSTPEEKTSTEGIAVISQAILDYLAECPQAMDTLEGIAEWWVMRQAIRVEIQAVAQTVDLMIEQGLLKEISIGGQRYYKMNQDLRPSNQ
ncbi:MAG: hypothetical protein L0Y67_08285 [Gammaproteobacteria bacterium]|nr:hypothetical protein [Gammaproteobacteria bacterium]